AGERGGLRLEENVAPPRLVDETLDHQPRDRGDGGEDKGAPPAGLRVLRRPDERKRHELGDPHRGEDQGELTTPGSDCEPEDREQEETSEAGCASACGIPEECGEGDVT